MNPPGLFGGQWEEYINPSDLDGTGIDSGSANVDSSAAPDASALVPESVSGSGANSAPSSSIWDDLLDAGKKVWTLPNTALGLAAGVAGIPFGAKPTFEHGAVVFNDYPWQVHGGGAVTLGNAILSNFPSLNKLNATYMGDSNVLVDDHEEGHVRQGETLGPLYLPTYVLQSIFSDGPSPMEKAADTYGQTGEGWWPW